MSNVQPKKLNLALHLDPVTSDADRAAMGALQHWYESTKLQHAEQDEVDMASVVRVFHRDVYLAGLRLYLIDSRFCRQVANAMALEDFSADMLVQQTRACGLVVPAETGAAQAESSFSAAQLEQLERLLAANFTANAASGSVEDTAGNAVEAAETAQHARHVSDDVSNAVLGRQLTEQGDQLNVLLAEVQQLRALAEQQALQLQRLKGGAPASPSVESARGKQTEEMSVADMAPQFEQIQKIRKKGVF